MKTSRWLAAAASAALLLTPLMAWTAPVSAARQPAAKPALHIPGSTGKVTPAERWHPTRIAGVKMSGPNGLVVSGARFSAASSCSTNLCYHGGPVQAHPRVYLVFWGTWWNCTDPSCANQNPDSATVETYLYNYWHQVGRPSENWATIMSQYHDSAGHHPSFGNGVWGTNCSNDGKNNCGWVAWQQDPPSSPTADDLAGMAATGAAYFGVSGDPNAQIIVLTPQGITPAAQDGTTFPDGGWCAYHAHAPAAGNVALTVMPWLPDTAAEVPGKTCDATFGGLLGPDLDGWSQSGGHEFAETVTDPLATSYYTNANGGMEIGDLCTPGKNFSEQMPNGKSYEQQQLWSNLDSNCVQQMPVGAVKNQHNSHCIDNAGGRTKDGNKIQLWRCNGTSAQLIYYTPSSGHLIVNGKCLDVQGASRNKGAKIILYHCTGFKNQKWEYDTTTHAWQVYRGVLGFGAMCLDNPGDSSALGAQLQIWDCNSGDAQKWTLPRG